MLKLYKYLTTKRLIFLKYPKKGMVLDCYPFTFAAVN